MTVSTMCSNILGPAKVPSLLIWPISMTGTPLDLAKRNRADAHSRTCVTLPGELSTLSVLIVWIESITTISGLTSWIFLKILSSEVSQRTRQLSALLPSKSADIPPACSPADIILSARIFNWWALSSPLTYSMRRPVRLRMV